MTQSSAGPFKLIVCTIYIKGVKSRSSVDALSELSSLFLKGSSSAFIAGIASGLFPKTNIGHSNNFCPNGPKSKKWDLITKT